MITQSQQMFDKGNPNPGDGDVKLLLILPGCNIKNSICSESNFYNLSLILLPYLFLVLLSNWFSGIISLARTSQEYHQRFTRTDKNYNFCINFIKMLFKPIFGDFVLRYRFSMSFDTGSSIFRNRFWVHIRC